MSTAQPADGPDDRELEPGLTIVVNEDATEAPWWAEHGFRCTTDAKAQELLAALRQERDEIARIEGLAADRIAAIKLWKTRTTGPRRNAAAEIEAKLADYREQLEESNPRLPKTYPLIGGALNRRRTRAKYVIEGEGAEAAAIEWGEQYAPEIVREKKEIDKLALAKLAGGSMIPRDTDSETTTLYDPFGNRPPIPGVVVVNPTDAVVVVTDDTETL